jgi:thiol-disulfide isomerase/thioredoxin
MKSLASVFVIGAVCTTFAQQPSKPDFATAPAFSRIPETASDSLRFLAPLTDFDAVDTAGKRWQAANLNGKITFINIWATTCGPCLREQPEIQRFFE